MLERIFGRLVSGHPLMLRHNRPFGGAALALSLLFGLTTAVDAGVNYYRGEQMVTYCEANTATAEGRADIGVCRGFLAAVVDTYATLKDWEKLDSYLCLPQGTPVTTLRLTFLNYMQIHIEDWEKTASSLALNAFNERWPCPTR